MDDIKIPIRESPPAPRPEPPPPDAPGARLAAEVPTDSRASGRLRRLAKVSVFAALFLGPIFHLPFTADPLFAKVVLVEILAVIAAVAWLANILVIRRISYRRTPLHLAFLVFAVVLVAATAASADPRQSLWGPDPAGERTASILSFLMLAFIAAATFDRRDVERASLTLLASLALLASFALASIAVTRAGGSLPAWLAINPVGTVNGLAHVLAIGFAVATGLILTRRTSRGEPLLPARPLWFAAAAAILMALALAFLDFRMAWIGLAAVIAIMVALNSAKSWPGRAAEGAGRTYAVSSVSAALAVIIVLIAAFAAFRGVPLAARIFPPPLEVSPSLRGTLAIAGKSLRSDPILGLGPANFITAYNRFRDPALNATPFWTARFSHGYSFAATVPVTLGLAGLAAFLGLVAVAGITTFRAFWSAERSDPYRWALGLGALYAILMWFFYAANFVATLLAFLLLGLFTALASEQPPRAAAEAGGQEPAAPAKASRWAPFRASWWQTGPRIILLEAPAASFFVSMAVITAGTFSAIAVYALSTQYAAEIWTNRAVTALSRFGNLDSAKVFVGRAISLNSTNDLYHRAQAELALLAVQRIVDQAAANPAQDLSAVFRNELAAGVAAAQRSIALDPADPLNRSALGRLYEAVVPFMGGADRAAIDAYHRAAEADPPNPAFHFAVGRVHLTTADLLTLQINQTASGEERGRLEAKRLILWDEAGKALEESLRLKSDYAEAHFLLAQIAIRRDDLAEAIRKSEETARLAPADVGVAFQLGVLYYRAGEFDLAKAEFERAILFNENYSNARYFLGLIWDRKGERDAALSQFQKIEVLNPGNEEVKRIIANLSSGRPALEEIVPPAPAPETRRAAPVRERAEEGQRPLRR